MKILHYGRPRQGVQILIGEQKLRIMIRGSSAREIREDPHSGTVVRFPDMSIQRISIEQLEHLFNAKAPWMELFGSFYCLLRSEELAELEAELPTILGNLASACYRHYGKLR